MKKQKNVISTRAYRQRYRWMDIVWTRKRISYANIRNIRISPSYDNNIMVVAYTESAEENGFYRLKKLGIDNYFKEVYVSDSLYKRPDTIPSSPKTHIVHGKKPNAQVLKDICCGEKVSVCEAVYIGDSLSKDMLMAKQAGIISVWCDFPRDDIRDLYSKLVTISHWKEKGYIPDYTIHTFGECKEIISRINKR